MLYDITINGKNYRLDLAQVKGSWQCRLDGGEIILDAIIAQRDVLSLLIGGKSYEIKRERKTAGTYLWITNNGYVAEVRDPRSLRGRKKKTGEENGPRKLIAPMPGKVARLLVKEKAEVKAGQGIVVIEAMKMQNEIKSPKDGIVQKLMGVVGASVNAGDVLAIVE